MSKASRIITLSADLAVLTIKEGVSNVTKILLQWYRQRN